jgi:hypothetical protein
MKQSAIAATSNVSGDQTPPGPSKSGGGAVSRPGNPGDATETIPVAEATALTV